MNDEFINPNYHVILVHLPLALLGIGTFIEIFSAFWRRSSVRVAGRWMIAIGGLSMLPTAAVGMYALADVVEPSAEADLFLERHAWLAGGATILSSFAIVLWIAMSDRWRRWLHWPLVLLIVVSMAISVAGAWYSGEAVYRHGAGVERIDADAERDPTTTQPQNGGVVAQWAKYLLPPLQAHVLAAGFSAAFGLAGLGLALRRLSSGEGDEADLRSVARRVRTRATMTGDRNDINDPSVFLRLINDDAEVTPTARTIPAARFWVIALLLAVAANLAGWWYLADSADAWQTATQSVGARAGFLDKLHALIRDMLAMVFERQPRKRFDFVFPRRAFHVLNGGLIIACMFTLAILARWAKRSAIPLALVSIILLASVGFQTWLGGLLMFDGVEGSVTEMANPD